MLGRLPCAHQDRRRRRKPERAGASDDQHGDERDGGEEDGRVGPEVEPHNERGDGERDHHRDEHPRDPVGKPLDRRLGGLRVLDELDDLTQRRVFAHPGRAERDAPRRVQRRTDHFVADLLGDGHRLPGEHRFVHRRRALSHDAVHRNLLPRLHDDEIARHDRFDRELGLLALAHHMRRLRLEPGEPADCLRRPPLGARLQ